MASRTPSRPAHPPLVPLRYVRLANGLTGKKLADRIAAEGVEVDENSLYNIELGHKRASNALMIAWAKALQITPLDIRQADRDIKAAS